MIELARRADGAFDLRVGGDTFNTAIYLARLQAAVSYMTAVGSDPWSQKIIDRASAEGVGCDTIVRVAGRMPGLYLIETTEGERRFWYWRERSPARELFELQAPHSLIERIGSADTLYLSGITLSIYSAGGLDQLERAITKLRARGGQVVMDGNFRPVGWGHDLARARDTYARFWRQTDIALPSFDDEQALWGDAAPADTFARLEAFGVGESCLKLAGQGALVAGSAGDALPVVVPPARTVQPVDTTAAGDSFSAAYLAARHQGRTPVDAADAGNRLAAIVIQHPGAIAPAAATAGFQL